METLTREEVETELDRYVGLMWKITNWWAFRNPWVDKEDIFAEVRHGFLFATKTFDKGRGVQFSTYAGWHGNNHARKFIRLEVARGLHVPRYDKNKGIIAVNVEELTHLTLAKEPDPQFEVPDRFWERIRAAVTPDRPVDPRYAGLKYKVVWLRFNRDWKMMKIAKHLGISKQAVQQHLASAARMIRERCPELVQCLE